MRPVLPVEGGRTSPVRAAALAVLTLACGLGGGSPVLAGPGPHDLVDLSRDLVEILNRADHEALHRRLSPSLQGRYSLDLLRAELVECRVLTHEIFRLSLPSWGARHFGFFGVYAETGVLQLVLEIDDERRIRHLVITDDMTAPQQQCQISSLE